MSARGKREDARRRLEQRYRQLADARKKRPAAAVAARFTEIDGATLGALVSVQLFTTVIPLIIIGFDYFSGFAENASPGTLFIREVKLRHAPFFGYLMKIQHSGTRRTPEPITSSGGGFRRPGSFHRATPEPRVEAEPL